MTQRLTYRSNARRTTSLTVSPFSSALANAASHRSSGMRIARGVVSPMLTPARHGCRLSDDLNLSPQTCLAAVSKDRHGLVVCPTRDGAQQPLPAGCGVHDLQPHPGTAVNRACGGHVAAYRLKACVHVSPLRSARIYTLGASVYTRQALWSHWSQVAR